MATRRTQPLRARSKRGQSMALQAAQRGKPRYRPHPMDARRQAMKKRRRKRYRARYTNPLARALGVRRNLGRQM